MVDTAATLLGLEVTVDMPVLVDTILEVLIGPGGQLVPRFLSVRVKLDRIARELRLDRGSMCLDAFLAAALGRFGQPRNHNVWNEVDQLVYFLEQLGYVG